MTVGDDSPEGDETTGHEPAPRRSRGARVPSESFFEEFFLSDYDRLRREHDSLATEIATYKRTARIGAIALSGIVAVVAFFGYGRIERIEQELTGRIESSIQPHLDRFDSILATIQADRIDSLVVELASLEARSRQNIDSFSRALAASDERARLAMSQLESRLVTSIDSVQELETLTSRLTQQVAASEREAAEMSARFGRLTAVRRTALRQAIASLPVNEALSRSELPFEVQPNYQSRFTHQEYIELFVPSPIAAGAPAEAYLAISPTLHEQASFFVFAVTIGSGSAMQNRCWNYFRVRGQENRFRCPGLPPGTYRAWVLTATTPAGESSDPLFYTGFVSFEVR